MNMSLLAIVRDNPDLAKRIEQGIKEVKETKGKILSAAEQTSIEYEKEINEGTRRKQLLIEFGKRGGKTESEVLAEYGKFLPSRQTPILNFLHFLLRDGEQKDWLKIHKEINESVEIKNQDVVKVLSTQELDKLCESLVHEDEKYENVKEPQEMDRYIYGNMSHSMFTKIKKLKALSTSENQNEAFLAYQLCQKLCKKYSLEFDKIPCNIE